MNDLKELRYILDDAITYADSKAAMRIAKEGLQVAREKKLLGEIMYFTAQQRIIEEDFEEALRLLDLAIRHNPLDGAAYNDRALCMIEIGVEDKVFDYFDKGIEVEPDYATIYHNKGWYLNKLGRHEEAIALFIQTLEIEPGRAVTYENMADALQKFGQKKEALTAYKKALALLKSAHPQITAQLEARVKELENSILS